MSDQLLRPVTISGWASFVLPTKTHMKHFFTHKGTWSDPVSKVSGHRSCLSHFPSLLFFTCSCNWCCTVDCQSMFLVQTISSLLSVFPDCHLVFSLLSAALLTEVSCTTYDKCTKRWMIIPINLVIHKERLTLPLLYWPVSVYWEGRRSLQASVWTSPSWCQPRVLLSLPKVLALLFLLPPHILRWLVTESQCLVVVCP